MGVQAERGAGLTDITWSRLVSPPRKGTPDSPPSCSPWGHRWALAHRRACMSVEGSKEQGWGSWRWAGVEGFGGPCTPEHSHQEQGKQRG